MNDNNLKKDTIEVKVKNPSNKLVIIILLLVIGGLGYIFINNNTKVNELRIKSTLEKIVEKSELQTLSYNYNVIAKKCKKENCDLNSNKIGDFEMVVSCKGKITAGIDIEKVKIDLDKSNKKLIIELPDAVLSDDPDIVTWNILNGEDLASGTTALAHNLCEETIIEKSKSDENILKNATEQAKIVLEGYYSSWIKVYDDSYTLEVK